MQQRQQTTRRILLLKTIFTDENGEQSVDHRLYKVLPDKTDEIFKQEIVDYLSKKYPKLLFSVRIYDWEKPIPAEALPDDLTLPLLPW